MSIQKTLFMCTALSAFWIADAPLASAEVPDNRAVVHDTNGNIVRSIAFGTCVRTKWNAGTDECADAPKQVAQKGPTSRTVLSTEQKTVYFDFDKSNLTADAKKRLDSVATILRGAKDVESADIVGYADRKGASDYNIRLSERRADTVKAYLAERGYLNTRRVDVRGLGETHSVTSCDTSLSRNKEIECLAPDRRVEVEVQYLDTQRISSAR